MKQPIKVRLSLSDGREIILADPNNMATMLYAEMFVSSLPDEITVKMEEIYDDT